MQLVAENIINKLMKTKIQLPSIKYSTNRAEVIKLYGKKDIEEMVNRYINILIYVNNRAGIFNSREDVEKGSIVICEIIVK